MKEWLCYTAIKIKGDIMFDLIVLSMYMYNANVINYIKDLNV